MKGINHEKKFLSIREYSMSTRPNYFKLGVFILMGLFLLVSGIILFGSGIMGEKRVYFETYFEDSVSGLSKGAPVQDNGVEIGKVEKISFVRNDYALPDNTMGFSKYRPYVRVVCSVRRDQLPELTNEKRQEGLDVLIRNGLRLQLSTNILTGQALVEAMYVDDPKRFPVEGFPWQTEYPYIPSAPSTFTTLKDSVDKILQRLEKIETEKIAENLNTLLGTVDKAVTDLNVPGFAERTEAFLDNANQAIEDAQIATLSAELGGLFTDARQTNQHLQKLLKDATPDQELSSVAELVDQMDTTVSRIDQLIRMHSPEIIEMIENFRQMSDNLKRLTEDLEKSPSMIFSKPPEKKEVPQ
jgi:phospholipid/cholesterol/gamma-HCH transport system substrate-binding protein